MARAVVPVSVPAPMYLDRRPFGLRFQMRVPADLAEWFGTSPLRVSLGPMPMPAARRIARVLAGCAELRFSAARNGDMSNGDPRDALIRELESMLIQSMADAEAAADDAEHRRRTDLEALELRLLTDRHQEQRKAAAFLSEASERIRTIHEAVKAAPRGASAPRLASLEAQMSGLADMMRQMLPGTARGPLLSDTLAEWIALQASKGTDPRRVRTLEARVRNFIGFAGDKPVDSYTFSDFQTFANVLVRVPENWSKRAETKNGNLEQAADYNDSLPERRRVSTLTGASIESNYLSPLRGIFTYLSAQYRFQNPLSAPVAISAAATESVVREPFTVEQLSTWFAAAARERRPDLKWLPLLGTVTGARVGELIYLQGKDIYELAPGLWVADLTTDLSTAASSETQERKLKTRLSRRTFALHQVLVDAGFVEYAKTRADDEWIFPHAFHSGKGSGAVERPADAASKRLNRRLRELGIHKPYEQTFHSARHTAKDIMRVAKIDERTSDRQTGHAPKTVSRRYGASRLRVDEVEVLAALPLPAGLDISPYMRSSRTPTRPVLKRKPLRNKPAAGS